MYITNEQLAEDVFSDEVLGELLQGYKRIIAAAMNKFYVVWEYTDSRSARILAHYKVTDMFLDTRRGLQVTLVSDMDEVVRVGVVPQKLPGFDIFTYISTDARVRTHYSEGKGVKWCSVPVTFSNKSQYGVDNGPFISDLGWFRANIPGQQNLHLD